MHIPPALQHSIASFEQLGRWDRAEVGRALRSLGLSYGEILELIPVPKGTLAGWCREIRLSDAQVAAIKQRRGPRESPRNTQWRRRLEVEQIRERARAEVSGLVCEPLWLAGTVLYWAEGSKTRRILELTNSDPRALRLFIAWVETYLNPHPEYVLSLNLHADNDETFGKRYWRAALKLETATFYKTFVKPPGTGHRKNHLPHGVCRVRVRRSSNPHVRTMEWIDVIAGSSDALGHPNGLLSLPGR